MWKRDGVKSTSLALPDDISLNPGAPYSFSVRAWDHSNQRASLWSQPCEFTPGRSALPPAISADITPKIIEPGRTALLSWEATRAASVLISGVGAFGPTGVAPVTPVTDTVYTLTAYGDGGAAETTVAVEVNEPPVALPAAVPSAGPAPLVVTLDGSSSFDPDGSLTEWAWDLDLDGLPDVSGPVVEHTFTDRGARAVRLSVTDDQGAVRSGEVTITVTSPLPQASLSIEPSVTVSGDSATLVWSTIDATEIEIAGLGALAPSGSQAVRVTSDTTYTLIARNESGEATASASVRADRPPVARLAADRTFGTIPLEVAFDAGTSSDPDSDPLRFEWDFDADGIVDATGATASHSYVEAGDFVASVRVIDAYGASDTASVTIRAAALPPSIDFQTSAQRVRAGDAVRLSWSTSNADVVTISPGVGPVMNSGSLEVVPADDTTYTLRATGPGGAAEKALGVTVITVDPPVAGSFAGRYDGLIPTDASLEAYDIKRFAVITGRALDIDGAPLAGVEVTMLGDARYGTAVTDSDGRFGLPVDGGGNATVVFRAPGRVKAQRTCAVPWNDIVDVGDVRLTVREATSTLVELGAASIVTQQHTGAFVSDERGTRAVTLVFPPGERAYSVRPDGSWVELDQLNIRTTEFSSQDAMPATLPRTTAFTYCVDLAADEAEQVVLDKPVVAWLDDFLGVGPGVIVPSGSYDESAGVWKAERNGLTVRLLDINGDGEIDGVDANRDEIPDDLDGDESTADEVEGIEQGRFAPGQVVWRMEVSHFSWWDWNFTWRVNRSVPTFGPLTHHVEPAEGGRVDCASTVDAQSGVVGEDLPIAGTGLSLHYSSDRVRSGDDRVSSKLALARTVRIPIDASSAPEDATEVVVRLKVAGKTLERRVPAGQETTLTLPWDGTDVFGQATGGDTDASISAAWVYRAAYGVFEIPQGGALPAADDEPVWGRVLPAPAANPLLERNVDAYAVWDEKGQVAPIKFDTAPGTDEVARGWTISAVPSVDSDRGEVLFRGDGTSERGAGRVAEHVAGPANGYNSDVDYGIDGTLWGAEGNRLVSVDPTTGAKRVHETRAGGIVSDVCADRDGGVYYLERLWNEPIPRLYHMDAAGTRSHVAGNGVWDSVRFDVAATLSPLSFEAMDVGIDGTLYIADQFGRLVSLGDDGRFRLVAGGGNVTPTDVHVAGPSARIYASDIACAPDGSIYLAGQWWVYRVWPDGSITHFAGQRRTDGYNPPGLDWSGKPANTAVLGAYAVEVDAAGRVLILDYNSEWTGDIVWEVDDAGLLRRVAGTRDSQKVSQDRLPGPASDAALWYTSQLVCDPAGGLLIRSFYGGSTTFTRVMSNRPLGETGGALKFTERSGVEHDFSALGAWVSSRDVATGKTLLAASRDASGAIAAITDRFGAQIEIERDTAGKPIAITSPDGLRTTLDIDSANRLRGLQLPDGARYGIDYDSRGLLGDVTNPSGYTAHHYYDESGRVVSATDEDGRVFGVSGSMGSNGYFASSMRTSEGTFSTRFVKTDTGGTTTRIVTARGSATTKVDSADGLFSTVTGPSGTVTSSSGWDSVLGVVRPESSSMRMPSGLTRTTTLSRSWGPAAPGGRPKSRTDRVAVNGRVTSSTVDFEQGRSAVRMPSGRVAVSTWSTDTLLPESISIPGLAETTLRYDSRGRITSALTGARESSYSYDASGNLASMTGSDGSTTRFGYDAVGRPTEQVRPDGTRIVTSYDKSGAVRSVVVPSGASHEFTTSKRGLPTSWVLGAGAGSFAYEYDGARRLRSVTTPGGNTITNSFDANGLPVRVEYGDGSIETVRGKCGRAYGFARASETASLTYDGSLVTREVLRGSVEDTRTFTYNSDFAPASFTYAGATQTYGYDVDGLLITAAPFDIARDEASGLATSLTAPGFSLSRGISEYGEVDAVDSGAYRYELERDIAGRIKKKTETAGATTHVWEYDYDALGRLATVTRDGALAESYAHDPQGNRTQWRAPIRGVDETVTAVFDGADRQLTAAGTTYTYGAENELASKTTSEGTTAYRYTGLGELSQVLLPDGREISYRYDAHGARVAKLIDGVVTERYEWAGSTRLLATYGADGTLTRRYLYADARTPYAVDTTSGRYYLHYDQVGSLRAMSDEAGVTRRLIDCDSFGATLSDSDPALDVALGFAGGLQDTDTGLVHFGARDYDPSTGRWTSIDPIGLSGGDVNLYGYCLSDPVGLVDPAGLLSTLDTPEGQAVMYEVLFEIASSAADVADVATTLSDCGSSGFDKLMSVGGAVAGAVLPGGGYSKVDDAVRLSKMAKVRALGRQGEEAVGAILGLGHNNGEIRIFVAGTSRYRVPDFIDGKVWHEVKNVGRLRTSRQLVETAIEAQARGADYVLWVREGAQVSEATLRRIDDLGIRLATFAP